MAFGVNAENQQLQMAALTDDLERTSNYMESISNGKSDREERLFATWSSNLSKEESVGISRSSVGISTISAVKALLVFRDVAYRSPGVGNKTDSTSLRDMPDLEVRGTGLGGLADCRNQVIAAIDKVLATFVSLECERQEYTEGCQRESAVLDGLKKKLDREEQQRLVVLPSMVQKEHEAAIRDIAELRWLVSFNDRERHRLKNRLDDIMKENNVLKANNVRWKSQIPHMEDKTVTGSDAIVDIAVQQKEATKEANIREDRKNEAEALYRQTRRQTTDEESMLKAEHSKLLQERSSYLQLSSTQQQQIQRCLANIDKHKIEIKKAFEEMDKLDGIRGVVEAEVDVQKAIVDKCRSEQERLSSKLDSATADNEDLKEQVHQQQMAQEGTLANVKSEARACLKALHQSRQSRDSLQHERDKLHQKLRNIEQKTKDAARGVVRCSEEMNRVDQQLEVGTAHYTTVKHQHLTLSERLKTDQEQVRDTELNWKATLEGLEAQRKEEMRTKTVFESKLTVEQTDTEKTIEEKKNKILKLNKILHEWTEKTDVQETKTRLAEEEHGIWSRKVEQAEKELELLRKNMHRVEEEFDHYKASLLPQIQAIKGEYRQTQQQVQELEAAIPNLEDTIEDLDRCMAVLTRNMEEASTRLEHLGGAMATLDQGLERVGSDVRELSQLKVHLDELHTKTQDQYNKCLAQQLEECTKLKAEIQESLKKNRSLALDYVDKSKLLLREKSLCLNVCEQLTETNSISTHEQQIGTAEEHSCHANKSCQEAWLSWGEALLGVYHKKGRESLSKVHDVTRTLASLTEGVTDYIDSQLKNNPLLYQSCSLPC